MKTLQGSTLDGHKLVLQLSQRKAGASEGVSKKDKEDEDASNKLIVRNLAFEATRSDVHGLFSPFGQVKSCRLPKKFDNTHRYVMLL